MNLFTKIYKYISGMFKPKYKQIGENSTNYNDFYNQHISTKKNTNEINVMDEKITKIDIVNLKRKYENELIDLKQCSNEEIYGLNLLYTIQNNKLKNSIIEKQKELQIYQDRMNNSAK